MARIFIGSIAPNIHGITGTEEIENDDELILYDNSSSANRKTKLSDFIAGIKAKITSIPYVCDYESLYKSGFAKIEAADSEDRPVILKWRGHRLQLISCTAGSAEFYGFRMAQNPEIGYVAIKPYYAVVKSDGTKSITVSKSYSPIPGVLTVKLTEKDGTISADKGTDDFAFAIVYDVPVEVLYNGLRYRKNVASKSAVKYYAIDADENGVVIHELTYAGKSWSHRTIAGMGTSGSDKAPTPAVEVFATDNISNHVLTDGLSNTEASASDNIENSAVSSGWQPSTHVEVLLPPPQYSYNGTLLLGLPEEVKTALPYCYMNNLGSGKYSLICSTAPWYYASGIMNLATAAENRKYTIETGAFNWTLTNTYNDTGNYSVTEGQVFWASHDIPKGSATATEIYFEGSEPVLVDTSDN